MQTKAMKRIAIGLLCPLIGALLLTSCLGNDDETVKSSEVALLTFGIQDLKTTHTIKTDEGTDSTYTTVMSGSTVTFTIDQTNRLVYNSDSIAYGTNVEKVLVKVTADGYVYYLKQDGELGSVEDSINFTSPVTFRVKSYDEQYTRDYLVSINVHQVDPKKTVWQEIKNADFPDSLFTEQKAFIKDNSLYVLAVDTNGVYQAASADIADGATWTTTECSGVEGAGLAALLIEDAFYLKTDAGLYRSDDAIAWSAADDFPGMSALAEEAKSNGIAFFAEPLSTNDKITRSVFVATPETADTCAQVWTKLSTEAEWKEIGASGDNVYGCPNLENLAVIRYADKLYAFGGKSVGDCKEPLEAFSACYESRDHGVTWKVNEEALSLPEAFKGREESFSTATDGEYVWVMWSGGEVWRGRWNGIN